MTNILKYVVLGSAVLGMAACTSETKARWGSEAGAQLDSGYFGNATVQNMIAQTCHSKHGAGGLKGGAVSDPVVSIDPTSTSSVPVYRVHCDGNLNGKYAQVVFNEYVLSAQPEQQSAVVETNVGTASATE